MHHLRGGLGGLLIWPHLISLHFLFSGYISSYIRCLAQRWRRKEGCFITLLVFYDLIS